MPFSIRTSKHPFYTSYMTYIGAEKNNSMPHKVILHPFLIYSRFQGFMLPKLRTIDMACIDQIQHLIQVIYDI